MTRVEWRVAIEAMIENIDREEQASAAFKLADTMRRQEELARMKDYRGALIQPLAR